MRRVSGPLLDRIDLRVVMPRMDASELIGQARPESSDIVSERIMRAWQLARERNGGQANALLRGRHLLQVCAMREPARRTLREVAATLELTARGVHRALRVARTVADLRQAEAVGSDEILAAASMRDRSLETDLAA